MEYADESLPAEHIGPEDAEFNSPDMADMADIADIRRRGVAPSLLAAEQKWDGMFKRCSPLVAWQVAFRTFRRSHSGDTSFPEAFPELQTFFDKCKNVQVIEWIVGVYEELVAEATAAGIYMPGDKTEQDIMRDHVVLWAGRHGHWQMQVSNPASPDQNTFKAVKKRGMFDPKPPKMTEEQRKEANRLKDEAAKQAIPKMIPKTFMLSKMQKVVLRSLARRGLFAAPSGSYPLQLRLAVNWSKVFKAASALGKWCIYLRARHEEIAGKKSAATSTLASTPGSPSLAKRPRESGPAEGGSPSLKRVL